MDLKVIWTDPAIDDLGQIVRHIAAENRAAGQAVGLRILDRAATVAKFPYLGPVYEQVGQITVRCLTEGNYRIFYVVRSDIATVEVIAIRHSARQPPRF